MTLRQRKYLVEEDDNRLYYRRGMIINWRYKVDGVEAVQLLRNGKAKLTRSGNLVFLKIEGSDGMKRISAELVKGVRPEFWETPEMARKGNPFY